MFNLKFRRHDLVRQFASQITPMTIAKKPRQPEQQSNNVKANASLKIMYIILIVYDMTQPVSNKRTPLGMEEMADSDKVSSRKI